MALEKVAIGGTLSFKEGLLMWDVYQDTTTLDLVYDTTFMDYDGTANFPHEFNGRWLKASQDASTLQEISPGEYLLILQPDNRQYKFKVQQDPRLPKIYFGWGTDLQTGQQIGYYLEDLQPIFVPILIGGLLIAGLLIYYSKSCVIDAILACGRGKVASSKTSSTWGPIGYSCEYNCKPP